MDGTGTVTTVFTAGSNGSYVQRIVARPAGTNVASVLRVFINNGSASSTNTNNVLFTEVSLPGDHRERRGGAAGHRGPAELRAARQLRHQRDPRHDGVRRRAVSLIGGNY